MIDKINHKSIIGLLAGLAIPLSTALQNGMLYLVIVLALFDSQLRSNLGYALTSKLVKVSIFIYGLFLLGVLWSNASHGAIIHMLIKIQWFIIVPFIFACMANDLFRKSFWLGFLGGVVISLIFSYGTFLVHKPLFAGARYTMNPWCTFRGHVYYCYFVTLFALIIFWGLLNKFYTGKLKALAIISLILCAVNIIYLSYSRTGVMIFFLAIALMLILWNVKRGLILAIIALAILIPISYFTSSAIQQRLVAAQSDVNEYDEGHSVTSIGLRLEFHKNSQQIIRQEPFLGHGTGSFAEEYQKYTHFKGIRATRNPHNDYYWFGVELGLVGILALISLIIAGIYDCLKRDGLEKALGIFMLLTYAFIATQWAFFTDNVSGVAFPFLICALLAGNSFAKTRQQVTNLFLL